MNRVYLDSCVLIEYLKTPDEILSYVMERVLVREPKGFISTIHYMEVLGDNVQQLNAEAEARAQSLLINPSLTMVEAGRHVLLRARGYRIRFGLKALDMIHLATAVDVDADAFWTYDRGLLKLGDIEGIPICKPFEPEGPSLFSN